MDNQAKPHKNSMMRKVENAEKDKNSENTNPFRKPTIDTLNSEGASSFVRFPTAIDSFDVTKYLNAIEEKLSSINMTFEQRMFLEQIARYDRMLND